MRIQTILAFEMNATIATITIFYEVHINSTRRSRNIQERLQQANTVNRPPEPPTSQLSSDVAEQVQC